MIIRQTTTIVFEYPQDYLQEQEWCKTKGERWIHKSTSTLGAVYENTISHSIGQPNSSEKPNNCEPQTVRSNLEPFRVDEPQTECPQANICCKPCKECGACEEECGMWKALKDIPQTEREGE